MLVRVPGLLLSYTGGDREVAMPPTPTLGATLEALNARYPGLRFRIVDEQGNVRPHIKLFIDGALCRDLHAATDGANELMIVGALSGG